MSIQCVIGAVNLILTLKIKSMKKSKLFRLGIGDFAKGLIVSILTAILGGAAQAIQSGNFSPEQIKPTLLASGAAGVSYLIKNLATNEKDELLKK